MSELKNEVIFCSNGTTACFSAKGEQVESLQVPWIELYFKFLKSKGIKIVKQNFIFRMPSGRIATPIKLKEGWNWKIE